MAKQGHRYCAAVGNSDNSLQHDGSKLLVSSHCKDWYCCNTGRLRQVYRLKKDLHNIDGSISNWYGAVEVVVRDVPAD